MSAAIGEFIAAAAHLKLCDERFPQREQVEAEKRAAKDAFREGYLTYVRQTDPELIRKVFALQVELKLQNVKKKAALHATREFISLNCRREDLSFYTEMRELNEKGTAATKIVEWLQKPIPAAKEEQISQEDVKTLARQFIEARAKLRDTQEGKAWRAALNPFEEAVQDLSMPADQLVAILEEQKTSPYVIKMARHFAEKK